MLSSTSVLGNVHWAVQCSRVQYSTVQYSTVQYSTVQYSTVQYSTVQYSTVQYSAVEYKITPATLYSTSHAMYRVYSLLSLPSSLHCAVLHYSDCNTVQCTVQYCTVHCAVLNSALYSAEQCTVQC